MRIEELLARDGLSPRLRIMVLAIVAIWRGDWPQLQECGRQARSRGLVRQDLEESLLQAVLFCGFPRVVTAFEQLDEVWPATESPNGGGLPVAEQSAAGEALFAAIYGRNEGAVHAMLKGFHADFHDFVLQAAYGRILTRPHLGPQIREVLATAVLAAQDQLRQFVGHARGAMHFGSNRAELREALVCVFGEGPQVDYWLQRVR